MPDFIERTIEYITANPKDFINICFWVFTAFLAFMTFSNAKKTLFNPIRSEMVKYQMRVITEFIDNHTSEGFSIDTAINYSDLLKLNYEADYLFDILTQENKFENYQFDEIDNERLAFCRQNLGGLFEISQQQGKLYLESVYGDFDTTKQYIQTRYIKQKEQKNTDLFLQRFFLTTKSYAFYTDLISLQTNPFIPEEIKGDINTMRSNIYKNITILYELLSIHISQQSDVTYQSVYLQFLDRKTDHQKDLDELRKNISIYFKVNKV